MRGTRSNSIGSAIGECVRQVEEQKISVQKAKTEWLESQQKSKDVWATFLNTNPQESADVELMVKMSDMIHKAAIHMVEDDVNLGDFHSLLLMLNRVTEDESDFNVTEILSMALKAKELVSTADASPIGFLLALSEVDLSKALQPSPQSNEDREELMSGFDTEVKAIAFVENTSNSSVAVQGEPMVGAVQGEPSGPGSCAARALCNDDDL